MRTQVAAGETNLGYRVPLHDGDRGTTQTIRLMRQLVDRAITDPQFIRFAVDLVRGVPAYDNAGEVEAIFSWVQANIRYTMDPVSKEKLYPPQELLKIRAGDCDDISMLIGALCLALGYPARLITLGANPQSPNEFSHVYAEIEVPPGSGNWIPLDAARPGSGFGLQPPGYTRKRAWSLIDDSYQDMKGATRLKGLSGYCGMGDFSDIDWSQIFSQSIQETPQIIAAVQGNSSSVRLPSGATVSTGSPYASFATPYTPGYASPQAGYGGLSVATSGLFSNPLTLLAAAALAWAVLKR